MTNATLDTNMDESIVQSLATQIVAAQETHPTGRKHKYPVTKGALVERNYTKPAEWNELIASSYEVEAVDTTDWTYANNFRKLNMYQRWTMKCLCCNAPIMQCLYNETTDFTGEQWGPYMKTLAPLKETPQDVEPVEPKPESTRRKHGSFKISVSLDDMNEVKAMYISGKTLAEVSESFNIAPVAVSAFLSQEGVMRKRGHRINASGKLEGLGRKKTTNDITPELLANALSQFPAKGVSAIAKELNLNQSLLSQAIKATGVEIKRGRGEGVAVVTGGKRGRVKTTLVVDKHIVAQGLQLLEIMGVVAAAKELNVNPNELSIALKNAGAVIKRGRK